MADRITCPKCKEDGGDDWRQCGGSCPMAGSPHYNPAAVADTVSVTQADRLRAARILGGAAPDGLLAGRRDSLTLVQELARHRLASTQPAPAFRREEELIEALRPFVEAADDLDEKHHDSTDIWEAPAAMSINAGHLRRAAALLQGKQPDG